MRVAAPRSLATTAVQDNLAATAWPAAWALLLLLLLKAFLPSAATRPPPAMPVLTASPVRVAEAAVRAKAMRRASEQAAALAVWVGAVEAAASAVAVVERASHCSHG